MLKVSYLVRYVTSLQNATAILLQDATKFITKFMKCFIAKCDSFITKFVSYYKMHRFRCHLKKSFCQMQEKLKTYTGFEFERF